MYLKEYAAQITANAEKLQAYLDEHNETLGFEANDHGLIKLPLELQEARISLMSACQTLNDLVDGAEAMITCLPLTAVHDVGALRVLIHYHLYRLVPRKGSISYVDLAKSVNMELHRLKAYVRHLITRRIFQELESGEVAHSAASILIADNESLQSWIAMLVDDTLEAVHALPKTYDAHGLSLDPNLSPFNLARNNTSVSSLELVISDSERGPRFAKGLQWIPSTALGSNDAIINSYPWDKFGLVVDVSSSFHL